MTLATDTIRTVAAHVSVRAVTARLSADDLGGILTDMVLEGHAFVPTHLLSHQHGGDFDFLVGWDETFLALACCAQDYDNADALPGYDIGLPTEQKIALLKLLMGLRDSAPVSDECLVEFGHICGDWDLSVD